MNLSIRLIDDWHQCWRWSSMRLMALSGAIQSVLLAFPGTLAQYVPQWIMSTLATASLLILVLAAAGRVTTMEKPHDLQSPHSAE